MVDFSLYSSATAVVSLDISLVGVPFLGQGQVQKQLEEADILADL